MQNSYDSKIGDDLVCVFAEGKMLRYNEGVIEVTKNSGVTWDQIPWKTSLYTKTLVRVGIFPWPPVLDCFGWRNEKIAVGFHSLAESELDIGKFIASFDEKKGSWTLQYLGRFDLVDGVLTTWFEKVGFDTFSRMQRRLDN